jgi:hypothetical protein
VAALAAGALALGNPTVSLASCVEILPIEKAVEVAELVFVGNVTSVSNGSRWATVVVKEVWRGPDLAPEVVVKGGPDGNSATSIDRTFEAGQTYIFTLSAASATDLTDNSCSSTQPWAEAMTALRPADSRPPTGQPAAAANPFGPIVGIVGVALAVSGVLLVVGLLARGRDSA